MRSVFRNRLRSLFAIVGIVIALALIVGSWIAVDSSAYGMMRAAIDDVLIDFRAEQQTYEPQITQPFIDDRIEAMEGVDGVEQAASVVKTVNWDYKNESNVSYYEQPYWDGYYMPYGTLVFLDRNDSDDLIERLRIHGEMPSPGTVAVPESVASALGLEVGDDITLERAKSEWWIDNGTYRENRTYMNFSYEISQIWAQDYEDGRSSIVTIIDIYDPVVFDFADYPEVMAPARAFEESLWTGISYAIWIDRDEVITLSSVPRTVDRLDYIYDRLSMRGYTLDFYVYETELGYVLMDVYPRLEIIKIIATALCLPVLALGIYLSVVGVDLGVNQRRREVGILKSRGASNKQVFGGLIMESVVLGTLAGLIGLASGLLVSRLLLDLATTFAGDVDAQPSLGDLFVQPTTIVLAILFGIGLMLISSYRPFKKISKTDVSEALHHYSPLIVHVDYKARLDIIFLSLSVLSIVSIKLGTDWVFDNDWSWIVQGIVVVLMLIGIVFFPLMPFLLSLSIVRLLTRGSRKLYAKFTWLVKPWTKELHHLVDRNIVRNPRRASNLCVIISLALSFGIFISVTMESSIAFAHDEVKYSVGADVRVQGGFWDSGYSETHPNDLGVLDELAAVPGTDGATTYAIIPLTLQTYGGGGMSTSAILVDAESYEEVVRPSGFYFVEGGRGALEDLRVNGTVLINEYRAEEMSLVVGDLVRADYEVYEYSNGSYEYERWPLILEIVGIIKGLPGLSYYYTELVIDFGSVDFIPEANLTQASSISVGAIYDVQKGVEQRTVADAAEDALTSEGFYLQESLTLDEELEELQQDPTFGALADFLYAEYAFSATIMTVGVGLLVFVAVSDREQELACIMARGSSGGQMRKILMGESITLMVIGLIVGISVGLLTAYLFNSLWDVGSYSVIERRMVFTWVSGIIVGAAVAALLVASLLATARAGKIKLAEVLRIRGG